MKHKPISFRIILLFVFFNIVIQLSVLADPDNSHQLYLFPDFANGKVLMKSGEFYEVKMDYNMITEEMIFEQGANKLSIGNLEQIDTIYLQNKSFVPEGNVFYDVRVNGPVSLFIEHRSKFKLTGTPAGYGVSTQSTSNTSIATNTSLFGANYTLLLPEKDYSVYDDSQVWIRKDNVMYRANNEKQLLKIFPEKSDLIKQYIKQNKIDLNSPADQVKLVIYCNQLMQK